MSNKWTEEQQGVIDSRGGNLLVAAAAGSGKTAILVQRLVDIITDKENPLNINELLVVTFTNAAALEMKERVQIAIEKLINDKPNDEHLKKQLVLIERANIKTIHSFCLDIIRDYFYLLDLSPDFAIGSEQELTLMKLKSMDVVFEALYKQSDKDFLELIDQFGGTKGDRNLRELMLNLYHFIISSPDPVLWLDKSVEEFNISDSFNFSQSESCNILIDTIKMEFKGILQSMELIVEQTNSVPELIQYNKKYLNEFNVFTSIYNKLDNSWEEIKYALDNVSFEDYKTGMKRLSKTTEKDIKDLQKSTKTIRDNCKKSITALRDEIFFRTDEDIKKEYKHLHAISKGIRRVLLDFMNEYQKVKKEKNIIDFNDIEHFAINILTTKVNEKFYPSSIAQTYSDKFAEIFIDEYQDSNLTQELLLSVISKNNRFMVGDLKQSIYKFRQARPELFLEKYNTYSTDMHAINKKILLHKNFRSRKEVLDATNFIFKHIMKPEIGGMDYGPEESLNPGGYFKESGKDCIIAGGSAELHLISDITEKIDDEDDLNKIQKEAKVIGNIIKELVMPNNKGNAFNIIDKKTGEFRNATFGDIAILLRTTSNWQEVLANEFEKMGIPLAIDSSLGYLNLFEINTSIAILKAICNPLDDISLVGALRTQLFKFDVDDLIELRAVHSTASYYELLKFKSSETDNLGVKSKETLETLDYLLQYSKSNSIADILEKIYEIIDYYTFIEMQENGYVRKNNLALLVEKAEIYSHNNGNNIFDFVTYLEELKERDLDLNGCSAKVDYNNAVNLMTIHRSKGLEFPIVICAGMGKQFNNMDLKNMLLYDNDMGYGPQIIDNNKKISYPSIKKEAIKRKMNIDALAEEIRILYVALTRAKEKLIITGVVKNLESTMEKWGGYTFEHDRLPAYAILKATNYLDWIVPSLLKHPELRDLSLDFGIEDIVTSKHESKWDYRIWDGNDIPEFTLNYEKEKNIIIDFDAIIDGINKQESFVFTNPYQLEAISVTDFIIKVTNKESLETDLSMPELGDVKSDLTGIDIGNIYHEAIYKLRLNNINSFKDLELNIDELIDSGRLLSSEVQLLNLNKIWSFLNSDLGKRVRKSKIIKKEQPISILLDKHENISFISFDKTVLINGVIDMYFEEDDGIVIIDYKTDHITHDNKSSIIKDYSIQLRLYKEALEKVTRKKVKQCYLHLFSSEESIKII